MELKNVFSVVLVYLPQIVFLDLSKNLSKVFQISQLIN